MGYILPVQNFQYIQYTERVVNESSKSTGSVEPVEKGGFKKILEDNFHFSEKQEDPAEVEQSRQRQYDAFQAHLAKISGKGVIIDKIL